MPAHFVIFAIFPVAPLLYFPVYKEDSEWKDISKCAFSAPNRRVSEFVTQKLALITLHGIEQ